MKNLLQKIIEPTSGITQNPWFKINQDPMTDKLIYHHELNGIEGCVIVKNTGTFAFPECYISFEYTPEFSKYMNVPSKEHSYVDLRLDAVPMGFSYCDTHCTHFTSKLNRVYIGWSYSYYKDVVRKFKVFRKERIHKFSEVKKTLISAMKELELKIRAITAYNKNDKTDLCLHHIGESMMNYEDKRLANLFGQKTNVEPPIEFDAHQECFENFKKKKKIKLKICPFTLELSVLGQKRFRKIKSKNKKRVVKNENQRVKKS